MKRLRIQFPIGKTFVQAFLLLVAFLTAAEVISRTTQSNDLLGNYESFGSAHPHFDMQMINIRARAKKEGKVDCIIFGNSQVLYGINPAALEEAYFENTGKKIICQNFGLGGVSPLGILPLMKTLINIYSPSIIIYGTSIIDYTIPSKTELDLGVESSPWLRYQLGQFTIDGLLIENSVSF